MRPARADELGKILERGYNIDNTLASRCAYYPLFRFLKWIDKKTGEPKQGQVFVCKDCTFDSPSRMCKHGKMLLW